MGKNSVVLIVRLKEKYLNHYKDNPGGDRGETSPSMGHRSKSGGSMEPRQCSCVRDCPACLVNMQKRSCSFHVYIWYRLPGQVPGLGSGL